MKHISYLTQGTKGLFTVSEGKMLFPHRDFITRAGAVVDIEVAYDKDKYAFIKAKNVTTLCPPLNQLIESLSQEPFKCVVVNSISSDQYNNSYARTINNGMFYTDFAMVNYDDLHSEFHEVEDMKHDHLISVSDSYFDHLLSTEVFDHDNWTKDNIYRVAEVLSRYSEDVYMNETFVVISTHLYSDHYAYFAYVLKNNTIIRFPVSKDFKIGNNINIINDIFDVLKEMPIGINMNHAMRSGYSTYFKYMDLLNLSNENDVEIKKMILNNVIQIFSINANNNIIFSCINNEKLGIFESLSEDTQDNIWDFIDHINDGSDKEVKRLLKLNPDPKYVSDILWRKHLGFKEA